MSLSKNVRSKSKSFGRRSLVECLESRTLMTGGPTKLTVTNLLPSGTGSLSAEVHLANAVPFSQGPVIISFAAGLQGTIPETGPVVISGPAGEYIQGPSAGGITVSGQGTSALVDVAAGDLAAGITNLSFVNGAASTSGGDGSIEVDGGSLTLNNVSVSATANAIYVGAGATASFLNLTESHCTGVYSLEAYGPITVYTSTFVTNNTTAYGIACFNSATFQSVAVNQNKAGNGGIFLDNTGLSGVHWSVTDTTLYNNLPVNNDGGPGGGGLIATATVPTSLAVADSTFAYNDNNTGDTNGGGISIEGTVPATLTSNDVAYNIDTLGGLWAYESGGYQVLTTNGIYAGNFGSPDICDSYNPNGAGAPISLASGGYNLDNSTSTEGATWSNMVYLQNSDELGVGANLAQLAYCGGPNTSEFEFALTTQSLTVIGNGNPNLSGYDQTGTNPYAMDRGSMQNVPIPSGQVVAHGTVVTQSSSVLLGTLPTTTNVDVFDLALDSVSNAKHRPTTV